MSVNPDTASWQKSRPTCCLAHSQRYFPAIATISTKIKIGTSAMPA